MILKRPKNHRLLHSLVFSSVLCLQGCAGTLPESADASSALESPEPERQLSASAPDPLADARICERGWPTTKAGNGNSFQDCKTTTLANGSERTECSDQEGRCALP